MELKHIDTKGICYIDRVPGTDRWYWGTDYTSGDLYEAEELFNDGHSIGKTRMIFVSYPEGEVREPLETESGQYFGNAVFWEGRIFCLLADFGLKVIRIYRCSEDAAEAEIFAEIPLEEVRDCYNLMLHISPLTLTRQGHEDRFQVIWPEKGDFAIAPQESLDSREGDLLIFGRWYEDPDYREETVIRRYPTGEILDNIKGTFVRMPGGETWLLDDKKEV